MNKEKLRETSAFPVAEPQNAFDYGMSKRFYAACAALTGIMANSNPDFIRMAFETAVEHAYKCADELLKQENE